MNPFGAEEWPRFVYFHAFRRDWQSLGLGEQDLLTLERLILERPTRSPVIQGTGGLRKFRFAGHKSSRGKSGSNRVCYVYFPEYGTIAMVAIFGKNEKNDLSQVDRRAIGAMIVSYRDELADELRQRRRLRPDQQEGENGGRT